MTKTAGFTLIELMIVLAIITTLAAMAVPTFLTYRDMSRVAQVVGSSEAIRSALASYAANSTGNTYPPTVDITDFTSLRLMVNSNGGMLPSTSIFTVSNYTSYDSHGDGVADSYSMRLIVNGVPTSFSGAQILLTPEGIFKCTPSGSPC
jgi:prepilin-type N-terminal cleavage/methylation domain-containing protein